MRDNATNRWLNLLAKKHCDENGRPASDYRLAKVLKRGTSAISNYRCGRSQMDDDVALQVAEELGVFPIIVIAEIHAERGRSERTKRFWMQAAQGKVAAVILSASASAFFAPSSEGKGQGSGENPDVYYVK